MTTIRKYQSRKSTSYNYSTHNAATLTTRQAVRKDGMEDPHIFFASAAHASTFMFSNNGMNKNHVKNTYTSHGSIHERGERGIKRDKIYFDAKRDTSCNENTYGHALQTVRALLNKNKIDEASRNMDLSSVSTEAPSTKPDRGLDLSTGEVVRDSFEAVDDFNFLPNNDILSQTNKDIAIIQMSGADAPDTRSGISNETCKVEPQVSELFNEFNTNEMSNGVLKVDHMGHDERKSKSPQKQTVINQVTNLEAANFDIELTIDSTIKTKKGKRKSGFQDDEVNVDYLDSNDKEDGDFYIGKRDSLIIETDLNGSEISVHDKTSDTESAPRNRNVKRKEKHDKRVQATKRSTELKRITKDVKSTETATTPKQTKKKVKTTNRFTTVFESQGIPQPRTFTVTPVDHLRTESSSSNDRQNLRRSKRFRIKPLEFWKGECIEYGPNDFGDEYVGVTNMSVPKFLKKAEPTPYKPRKITRKSQLTSKKNDESSTLKRHSSPERFDDTKLRKKFKYIDENKADIWNDTLGESVEMKVICRNNSMKYRELPRSKPRKKSDRSEVGKAAQAFYVSYDYNPVYPGYIMGKLNLPPKGIKDAECVGSCAQTFTILTGQPNSIELAFADPGDDGKMNLDHAQRFLLDPGDVFRIPPGNTYHLQNHSKTDECIMSWTIIRPTHPEDMEENSVDTTRRNII